MLPPFIAAVSSDQPLVAMNRSRRFLLGLFAMPPVISAVGVRRRQFSRGWLSGVSPSSSGRSGLTDFLLWFSRLVCGGGCFCLVLVVAVVFLGGWNILKAVVLLGGFQIWFACDCATIGVLGFGLNFSGNSGFSSALLCGSFFRYTVVAAFACGGGGGCCGYCWEADAILWIDGDMEGCFGNFG